MWTCVHDTSFNGQILKGHSSYTNWTLLNRGQTLPWKPDVMGFLHLSIHASDSVLFPLLSLLDHWPLQLVSQKLFWSPHIELNLFFLMSFPSVGFFYSLSRKAESPAVEGPGESLGWRGVNTIPRAKMLFTWLWRVGTAVCSSVKWRF